MKNTILHNYKESVLRLTFLLFSITVLGSFQACNESASAQNNKINSDTEKPMSIEAVDQQKSIVPRSFTKAELLGKLNPAKDTGFVKIDLVHSTKSNIYLRNATYDAFKKMFDEAKKSGIKLVILSATRNFDAQKSIWEKKWSDPKYSKYGEKERASQIMKFSSMPGTSRHHWGTDIDMNSLSPTFFNSGEGKKIYDWLSAHASEYGFYQTYTSKSSGRTGYEEEKWHWTYLPLSGPMLIAFNDQIKYTDISGFNGSSSAASIQAIELYVNGIDSSLLSK